MRDLPVNASISKKRQKQIQTAHIQVRPKKMDEHRLSDTPNLPGIANSSAMEKRRQHKHKYMPSQMGPRRHALNNSNMQRGSVTINSDYHNQLETTQVNDDRSTTLNIKVDGMTAKISEFQSNTNQQSGTGSQSSRK